MMNVSEIQQRFTQIEHAISEAAEICLSDASVPKNVRDRIEKLDSETDQVGMILDTHDEERIIQCVEDLEEMGDHAKDACERAPHVTESVRLAVMQAHRHLSDLKHQMH